MNITVEIKAPELATAILALANALSGSGLSTVNNAVSVNEKPAVIKKDTTADKPAVTKSEPKKETAPVDEKKETKKEDAPPSDSKPEIKLETVRARLAEVSQKGKQKEVKALIGELGYKKLTEVPVDKYAELLTKAEAL